MISYDEAYGPTSLFAVLIMLLLFYVLSTIILVFLLTFDSKSVRALHILTASFKASLFSIIASFFILFIFVPLQVNTTLVFFFSNFFFQALLLTFAHDIKFNYYCIPLLVSNSFAYILVFTPLTQLLHLPK